MKKTMLLLCLIFFVNCNDSWHIAEDGLLDVFPKGLQDSKGRLVNAEISAVTFDGTSIYMGNDKDIPGNESTPRSPIVYMTQNELQENQLHYLVDSTLIKAKKYEDFTITPDGEYIFATTGFDRVHPDGSGKWDNYNTLVCWKTDRREKVQIIYPYTRDGITSSVSLRKLISGQLASEKFPNGPLYFKIEGLAAFPANALFFGIREVGKSYKNFEYTCKMVAVSYTIKNDSIILNNDLMSVFDFDMSQYKDELMGQTVALSSIAYNKYDDAIYFLTSYEHEIDGEVIDESIGAFIWRISEEDVKNGNGPQLLRNKGKPIHFPHKAEGMTFLDENTILVVHDDDRVLGRENITNPNTQFHRKRNQCAYTILRK